MEASVDTESVEESTADWWSFVDSKQFWKWLLIGGIILNAFTAFTSDLGVDTHLHLAEDDDGSLVWGHTRPIDHSASDPNYAPSGGEWDLSLAPTSFGEIGVRGLAITLTLLLIGLGGAAYGLFSKGNGRRAAALIAFYPTFVFSTGRAYAEPTIAMFVVLIVLINAKLVAEKGVGYRIGGALASAICMIGIMLLKGINPIYGGFFGLAVLAFHLIDIYLPSLHSLTRNPLRGGLLTSAVVGITMLTLGVAGSGATLSVISMDAPRFFTALLVSIFNIVLVYSLFGMMIWPFVGDAWKKLADTEDMPTTFLTITISGFTTAITIYVAALWTYESIIWNADWPWVMWTMGNNGRYISLIMIPILMLLAHLNHLYPELPSLENPGRKSASFAIGILLIIPLTLLAGIHGQTFWTDDAAELLDKNMEDGEDFLFIHEGTLGMHYLYTFHTGIDDVDQRNITGHWRSPDSGWQNEMVDGVKMENRGNLSNVQWVVLSPGLEWSLPNDWNLVGEGNVDFMNGGGLWEIWSTHTIE
ncbi:MAG: hypothetical protein HOE69_07435 [Euryarchaeota archaeon]|nr:hypothetical protein [Euryarchaeota archaeon]